MTRKGLQARIRRVWRRSTPRALRRRFNLRLLWRRYNKRLHVLLWVLALVIGPWSFKPEVCDSHGTCEPRDFLDRLYLTLQLFTLESGMADGPSVNGWLEAARFFAAIAAAWTLLRTIGSDFIDLMRLQWAGLVGGHFVVCGLGQTGALLVETLTRRGVQVVVIEKDPNGPYIAQAREQGATVVIGDATQISALQFARVGQAARIIAVTTPDSTNVEIAFQARAVKRHDVEVGSRTWSMRDVLSSMVRRFEKRNGRPLICIVHIAEPRLWSWLQGWQAQENEREYFRLEPVNAYDAGARVCLDEYVPFTNASVEQGAPRVLLVGLGRFGARLLIQTGKLWRDQPSQNGHAVPLGVTIVDRQPGDAWATMVAQHPELAETCRVSWVRADVGSPEFQSGISLVDATGRRYYDRAYVCLEDEVVGLEASLALLRATASERFPIVVRLHEEGGLARMLRDGDVEELDRERTQPFSTVDDDLAEMLIEGTNGYLARMLHGAYLRAQAMRGVQVGSNSSMVAWRDLTEELRDSNRHQAEHIEVKLQTIHCRLVRTDEWKIRLFEFTDAEVELLARMEHDRFCEERRAAGWTHGDQRNNEEKIHPHLVPWKELKQEPGRPHPHDSARDTIRAMPAILARAGFRIERVPSWTPGGTRAAGG